MRLSSLAVLATALLASLVVGCGTPAAKNPEVLGTGGPWDAHLDALHPLVGRIWDGRKGAFSTAEALTAEVNKTPFVLLGEKHDNPDHHRLQARILRGIVRDKHAPKVVIEMVDVDEQTLLDEAWKTGASGLGQALGWEKRGWPSYALYQPIFETADEARLALVAGNFPRALARGVARKGLSSLDATVIAGLHLDTPLGAQERVALEKEIADAHCGHLPPNVLPTMADAQRARDAQMAIKLAEQTGGAVLIAGAGHVRTDRGAPVLLKLLRAGEKVVSIAFVEVRAGVDSPEKYAESYGAAKLPFDFVWFTPRLDNIDPCVHMTDRVPKAQ